MYTRAVDCHWCLRVVCKSFVDLPRGYWPLGQDSSLAGHCYKTSVEIYRQVLLYKRKGRATSPEPRNRPDNPVTSITHHGKRARPLLVDNCLVVSVVGAGSDGAVTVVGDVVGAAGRPRVHYWHRRPRWFGSWLCSWCGG